MLQRAEDVDFQQLQLRRRGSDWKTQLGLPVLTLDPGHMEGKRTIDGCIDSFVPSCSRFAVKLIFTQLEFTTNICLSTTFIVCFMKNMETRNFDLWSIGLKVFFLKNIYHMLLLVTSSLRNKL